MVLLAAFAAFTCFYGLSVGPPLGDHECINALAAGNALQTGEWMIPEVGDAPRIRKTPLGIWAIGLASWASDRGSGEVTAFAARLPSAIAAFGTVLTVCWLGSMMYGPRVGRTCGFIAAAGPATLMFARNAQVDMVLTFFTTLSFACFWRGALCGERDRRFLAGFYVAFALAMLAKAPLPLATIGLALAAYWFVGGPLADASQGPRTEGSIFRHASQAMGSQLRRLTTLWLVPGIVLWVVLVGVWPVYVSLHIDNALELWRIEYLSRFTGELSDKVRPWWYYLPYVLGWTLPYMLSMFEAAAAPFLPKYAAQRRGLVFAFMWALVGTCFLSTSSFKRPHYLLSIVPAYCLLLGPVIDRLFFAVGEPSRLGRALCGVVIVVVAGGGIIGLRVLGLTYPELAALGGAAIVVAVILWSLASWAYAQQCRVTSFALLNLGVAVLLAIAWPAMGTRMEWHPEVQALADKLDESAAKDATIYWVDGQPSLSLEFYHGFKVRRLVTEVEMASLRQGRRDVSDSVYVEVARRLQARLAEDAPAYFVVSVGSYDLLARRTDMALREVFRLTGFHEDAEDELVVFTRRDEPPPVSP